MMIRSAITAAVLTLIVGVLPPAPASGEQPPPDEAEQAGFTLSRETTYFTEPLLPDGSVDYAAAWNEQLSRGVTPENNACVQLFRAFGPAPGGTPMPAKFWELLGMEPPPADGTYFVSLDEFAERLSLSDEQLSQLKDREESARADTWSREDFPLLARWVDLNGVPLKQIQTAVTRKRYYSPWVAVDESTGIRRPLFAILLPGVQCSQLAARLLCVRGMLRLDEGDIAGAWCDLITCHRLGRHVGSGPTPLEAAVGYALERIVSKAELTFIRYTRPTTADASQYHKDLRELPPLTATTDKLDMGERCTCLATWQLLWRGREAEIAFLDDTDAIEHATTIVSVFGPEMIEWDFLMATSNDWYDRLVAATTSPTWSEKQSELKKIKKDLSLQRARFFKEGGPQLDAPSDDVRRREFAAFAGAVVGSLSYTIAEEVLAHEFTTRQRTDNVRTALALAAYRSDHDSFPDSLEQLVPAYLPEAPLDIFTGEPPVYRASEDGYLLYSVGENMQDDEGRSFFDEPAGDDLPVNILPMR